MRDDADDEGNAKALTRRRLIARAIGFRIVRLVFLTSSVALNSASAGGTRLESKSVALILTRFQPGDLLPHILRKPFQRFTKDWTNWKPLKRLLCLNEFSVTRLKPGENERDALELYP
jgi:hypothetical protein